MKKYLCLLLTLVMCMSLVACGGSSIQGTNDKEPSRRSIIPPAIIPATVPATIPATIPAAQPAIPWAVQSGTQGDGFVVWRTNSLPSGNTRQLYYSVE